MGLEQERTGSLNEKMDKLIEVLAPKTKRTKLPKLPKLKKGKLRQNYALVLYIMDNHNAEFEWVKMENNYIYIRKTNTFHLATAGYVINLNIHNKNIPFMIVPCWSLEPLTKETFDPVKHHEETVKTNNGANPQKVLITLMEQANLKIKGKMGKKSLIIILVIVVAGLYLISTIFGKGG